MKKKRRSRDAKARITEAEATRIAMELASKFFARDGLTAVHLVTRIDERDGKTAWRVAYTASYPDGQIIDTHGEIVVDPNTGETMWL